MTRIAAFLIALAIGAPASAAICVATITPEMRPMVQQEGSTDNHWTYVLLVDGQPTTVQAKDEVSICDKDRLVATFLREGVMPDGLAIVE